MMLTFKEYIELPVIDIPSKKVNSSISRIFYNRNPIAVTMKNGTVWELTKKQWDYCCAIGQEPREGKQVQIELFLDGTIKSVRVL